LFEGDAEFSAVNPQAAPLLEVSIPIGLNFRDNPGDIVNSSIAANGFGLSVNQGENIALIGGDVTLNNGNITAPGGIIELGGLSAAGEVQISDNNNLIFPGNVTRADVFLTNNSFVSVSLAEGGTIRVNARNLELFNGFLLAGVQNSVTSEAQAANITLNATEKLTIEGNQANLASSILNNGGNITISTGSLEGIGNFNLNSLSFGEANSGNINITARERISLLGTADNTSFISASADSSATGNSGNITIATPSLFLSNISIGAGSTGQSNAGNIQINTIDSIFLSNSFITTSSLGDGNAGDITIESEQGNISLDATRVGAIAIPAFAISEGDTSGNITIQGQSLLFTNRSNLFVDNDGTRNAGNITLEAFENIVLSDISQIGSNTAGQGNAGNIGITTKSLSIEDGSSVSAKTFGEGDGGNIEISASEISLSDQSNINTEASSQDGGNINLLDSDLITLRRGSQITAEAGTQEAAGNGGDITIDSDLLIAFSDENNDIIANSFEGLGGTIDITTDAIFGLEIRDELTSQSDITAFSQTDPLLNGQISINTPDFDPTSGLIELPQAVGDVSDQISQNPCEQGVGSEFIITGKGGLPPNVNESLNSESAEVGLIETVTSQPQAVGAFAKLPKAYGIRPNPNNIRPNPSTTTEAVPAQGWVFNDKGEVTLTAYKTTNTERPSLPKTPINSCSAP
jgi:large exoprotein involved in heme utilization and adhesion